MTDPDKLREEFAKRLLRLADRILRSFDQGAHRTISVDMTDYEDVIAASALALRTNAYSSAGEAAEVKARQPHAHVPSAMHMGDCAICGHVQDAPIHSGFSEKNVHLGLLDDMEHEAKYSK
jgi:hypothetical protein